jgi:hypothetical protein
MRIAESAGRSKACQVLHWKRAQDSCKRKGRVDFALFNSPHIAKSLMPVDNEPKRGGRAVSPLFGKGS